VSWWVELLQKYVEPLIFLSGLHRPIKGLLPPSRPYLCRRELERAETYSASGFVAAARDGRMGELKLFVETERSPNITGGDGETPLVAALAARASPPVVELLLKHPRIDVNARNAAGETALLKAVEAGDEAVIKVLLEHGAAVNTRYGQGDTALIVAARLGRQPVVELLLKQPKIDVNARNAAGETALLEATKGGHGGIVAALGKADACDPDLDRTHARWKVANSPHPFSEAELLRLVHHGKKDWVELFLKAGMPVEARDDSLNTALLLAAGAGERPLLELLLAHGAAINARNYQGDTALIVAARRGNRLAVDLFLQQEGLDVNARNVAGETALLEAATGGHGGIVTALQEAGASDPDLERTLARRTIAKSSYPFSEAVFLDMVHHGRKDWVELFLSAGMSVEARDQSLNTALILWTVLGERPILDLLLRHGVAVNARNLQGDTALIVAARRGNRTAVELLLGLEGIEVNARNAASETALLEAAKGEHARIVTALRTAGAEHPGLDRKVARWELEREDLWSEERFVREAGQGSLELVKKYLLAGMDPNACDRWGNTGLILAARNGQAGTVRVLLAQRKIAVNTRNGKEASALTEAAAKPHPEIVKLLLAARADRKDLERGLGLRLESEGHRFNHGTFVSMAGLGQRDLVERYLDAGMAVDVRDDDGNTALMRAAETGEKAVARLLLDRGAGVHLRNRFGGTALAAAIRTGHEQVAELLREKGAVLPEPSARELAGAVETGDGEEVRQALAAGVSPGREAESVPEQPEQRGIGEGAGRTSLLAAAERGELARVLELLDDEAALSARDERGNTALMLAARRGWGKIVEALFREGDLEQTNADGHTALMLAAAAGWTEVVAALLDKGARLDAVNSQGRTALLQAAAAGQGAVVALLAERGADPSLAAGGTTPLVEISRFGPASAVQALIDAGADVDQEAGFGASPLMAASLAGQAGIVELLHRAGARVGEEEATLFRCVRRGDEKGLQALDLAKVNLELRDERGRTVLLEAAEKGQAAVVRALLDAKASPEVRALNGDTALKLAAASGSRPALELLVEHTERDEAADTAALLAAVERGHAEAVELLVKKTDARIDGLGRGRVPLVVAAARGHYQAVETLLDLGADKDKQAANGQTALLAARQHGHQAIADLLERHGAQAPAGDFDLLMAAADGDLDTVRHLLAPPRSADPDARDEIGRTALMRACENGHVEIVKYLLEHAETDPARRAAIRATDRRGRTPLIWAAIGGVREIVSLLLKHDPETVSTRSSRGRTALMEACHQGWPGIVEDLLKAIEDEASRQSAVDERDNAGNTPLSEAFLMAFPEREQDYLRVVDVLERHHAALGRDEAELLDAARRCDPERLRALVARVEVDGPRRQGKTALILAVEEGCTAGAELLLDARPGAAIDRPGPFGATPLILAVRAQKLDSLRLLLERHASRDARDNRGETALFAAVQNKNGLAVDLVNLLIEKGANVDLPDGQGRTPLMQAVLDRNATLVHRLLEAKAASDQEDLSGRTALTLAHLGGRRSGVTEAGLSAWEQMPGLTPIERHLLSAGARRGWNEAELLLAARDGNAAEVRRLLDDGVQAQASDLEGNTALLWACHRGDLAMAQALLAKGANPDVRNDKGRTPLLESVEHEGSELVQALLRPGLSLDDRDDEGNTALLKAAKKGNSGVVIRLAEAGAGVNLGDHKRRTPLLAAVENCDLAAIRCLLERNANACARSTDHRTAAIEAAVRGDESVLSALLSHVESRVRNFTKRKAYLNAVAQVGKVASTALDLAERGGHTRCADLLRRQGAETVHFAGHQVYLTAHGDFYHRYDCGACAHGRRNNTLVAIPIGSPELERYPPCDLCNPSIQQQAGFDWKC
jgi:serine/threonine-protein phosphatase 6 regulatory ankyrin repeat subunit B